MLKARIRGKSGKDYYFQAKEIKDKLLRDALGIFIFVRRIKEYRSGYYTTNEWREVSSMALYSGILYKDIIKRAEENQAKYFLYLPIEDIESAMEIIEDLKEDENYKIKIHDAID